MINVVKNGKAYYWSDNWIKNVVMVTVAISLSKSKTICYIKM